MGCRCVAVSIVIVTYVQFCACLFYITPLTLIVLTLRLSMEMLTHCVTVVLGSRLFVLVLVVRIIVGRGVVGVCGCGWRYS